MCLLETMLLICCFFFPGIMFKTNDRVQSLWLHKSNCQMCRCGNPTLWRCGDVVDPHCQDVEMWWIHIFSVAVHINFEFIQE